LFFNVFGNDTFAEIILAFIRDATVVFVWPFSIQLVSCTIEIAMVTMRR
jgi:hypothetical protein